jgi:DNA-cytosine methyltransferase
LNKLKVIDLFSGIGGFSLGLHSTDIFETIKFVEFDKFCQKVLHKNFPNIPIEGDIRNVKGEEFEADVITGGFPCQPFSVAGRQKGTDDNRYLWPEMFRLIKEVKPEFVIGENVQGLINLQDGMVLRQVQDELEGEGFEVQCFLIPASGIGAWHRRNRVWIVGHSKHNGLLAAEKRSRDKKINGGTQEGQNQTIESERTSRSRNDEDVSNTKRKRLEGHDEHSPTISRENEGTQFRSKDSSRSDQDVSNTESIWRRKSRNTDQEEGIQESSTTQSNSSSEDVSNTISSLRRGGRTIGQSRTDKIWGFYSEEEKQTNLDLWSEIIRRNVVSREEPNSNTHGSRLKKRDVSNQSEGEVNSSGQHVKEQSAKTWWQTESSFCRIPNGISYKLDKDRSSRIKSLGNAIVPQMARIFGLAIKKVLDDSSKDN